MIVDGDALPLPGLAFTAATTCPTGRSPAHALTPRTEVLTGLSIPPGAAFELRFTAAAGAVADVFLNEFHYDNADVDCGEFLELVVGPGFTRPLADLAVVLYNGAPASLAPYATHPLDSFTPWLLHPHRVTGSSIRNCRANGIQNGSPDGIALVDRGNGRRFLSYGGGFTAASGPAAGMTAPTSASPNRAPIRPAPAARAGRHPPAPDPPPPLPQKTPNAPSTAGLYPNEGQSFAASLAAAQGISIDKLAVTASSTPIATGCRTRSIPMTTTTGDDDQETLLKPIRGRPTPTPTASRWRRGRRWRRTMNLAELRVTLTDPRNPNSAFAPTLRRAPTAP
jgi:hypothetical protein